MHFPAAIREFAVQAAQICEEAHRTLSPLLGHKPDYKTEVAINDHGDTSNGSATAIPYPRMQLFAAPPQLESNLGDTDDWMRQLIYHEYAHILTLDPVHGWPQVLNTLVGRQVAPNHVTPKFMLEGLSVWIESRVSGRGRLRSALFRGWLRAAALEGELHGLDAVVHSPQAWPGANVWYMYGGHFMDFWTKRHGEQLPAAWFLDQSDEIVPYGLNRLSKRHTGETMEAAFEAFQADLTERSKVERDLLAQRGLTAFKKWTFSEQSHRNPRFIDGQRLLSLDVPGLSERGRSGIYLHRMGEIGRGQLVIQSEGMVDFDLCGEGASLRIIATQGYPYRSSFSRSDLVMYDPYLEHPEFHQRRITQNARLREVSCSPSGQKALAVQLRAGKSRLVEIDLDSGAITVLMEPPHFGQIAYPVYSHDGRYAAYVEQIPATETEREPGFALYALDLSTHQRHLIRHMRAMILHPRFDFEGRIVYASDRSGIFQIYADQFPHPMSEPEQLTRVINSAIDPEISHDSQTLAFRLLTVHGYDLASMPYRPHENGLQHEEQSSFAHDFGSSTSRVKSRANDQCLMNVKCNLFTPYAFLFSDEINLSAIDPDFLNAEPHSFDRDAQFSPINPSFLANDPDFPNAAPGSSAKVGFSPDPELTVADQKLKHYPNKAQSFGYNPIPTLLPIAWTPTASVSNSFQNEVGIDFSAEDATSRHSLDLSFNTVPKPEHDNHFGYTIGGTYGFQPNIGGYSPLFQIGVSHQVYAQDSTAYYNNGVHSQRFKLTSTRLSTSLPLLTKRISTALSLSYGYSWRRMAENLDPKFDPIDRNPIFPKSKEAADLLLGFSLGNVSSDYLAISLERGFKGSVSLRIRDPHLGGELKTLELFTGFSHYQPLFWRHVLAFHGTGGLSLFNDEQLAYALTAPPSRNLVMDAINNNMIGSHYLRGYPSGALTGPHYILFTAEYRLPLFEIYAGPSSTPIFLRDLKLALFSDLGQAANHLNPGFTAYSKSVGAEFLLSTTLGWHQTYEARLGYAHGLDDQGEDQIYMFLGSWF